MHPLHAVGKMHRWLATGMIRPCWSQNMPAAAAAASVAVASAAVPAAAQGRSIAAQVVAVACRAAPSKIVAAPASRSSIRCSSSCRWLSSSCFCYCICSCSRQSPRRCFRCCLTSHCRFAADALHQISIAAGVGMLSRRW